MAHGTGDITEQEKNCCTVDRRGEISNVFEIDEI